MAQLNVEISEWQELQPNAGSLLRGVFLVPDPMVRRQAETLADRGLLEVREWREGIAIQASSFVGRIMLGDLQITIHPKLAGIPLLHLLRYAYGLRSLDRSDVVEFATACNTFQDFIVLQLVIEAREILSRGVAREYQRVDEWLAEPRGAIDVQRVAVQGRLRTARLPCKHHPRLEDCLPNQLLVAALQLGARVAGDVALRSESRRVASRLEGIVSRLELDDHVFRRWRRERTRLHAVYDPAVTLARLLVESTGITLDAGPRQLPLPGFLFDMNRFFQALLSRFLSENLHGYRLRDEQQLHGMLAYLRGHNPRGRRNPTPRPDFAVVWESKVVRLVDAKYRDLWELPLPREMLYQLAVYALSQPSGAEAIMLYPTIGGHAVESRIGVFDAATGGQRAQIVQRPVDLLKLQELVSARSSATSQRARNAYAESLVFGNAAPRS